MSSEQIEQLIADKLSGKILPADEKLLDEYIKSDPAMLEEWEDTAMALSLYKAVAFSKKVSLEERWESFERKMNGFPSGEKEVARHRGNWWNIAAAIIPFLFVAGWLVMRGEKPILITDAGMADSIALTLQDGQRYVLSDDKVIKIGALQFTAGGSKRDENIKDGQKNEIGVIEVPNGKTYSLELPDGTLVRLNAASKLRFSARFEDSVRSVSLVGEAYFKVAKDAEKPFVVHTEDMDIRVLGTVFNMKAYAGEPAQASLVTGKVGVRDTEFGQELFLLPGRAATKDGGAQLKEFVFFEDDVLGWLDGIYYFSNKDLESIMHTVHRTSGYNISIANEKIARLRFSGAYEKKLPITTLLEKFSASSSLRYSLKGREISLY